MGMSGVPEITIEEPEDVDDEEIEQLEALRRHGNPDIAEDDEEGDYYRLPPSQNQMLKDWMDWRTKMNDLLASNDRRKNSIDAEILTLSANTKTPEFFRGHMSIHGQRVKDEYGPSAITETDDEDTKREKKMMDNNFFSFGIPRVNVRRVSVSSTDGDIAGCPWLHSDKRSPRTTTRENSQETGENLDRPFQGLTRRRMSMVSNHSSSSDGLNEHSTNSLHPNRLTSSVHSDSSVNGHRIRAGSVGTEMAKRAQRNVQRLNLNDRRTRPLPPIPKKEQSGSTVLYPEKFDQEKRRASTGNLGKQDLVSTEFYHF
ncbi:uncharacterized protein LOC128215545 [Mya arenaria]|uniref:uncharacterized protein LOC128215545 n=1 Tax=Mya arenaria TaxID=6604 RepID=UPI0022DEEB81|nr:uncharacterized protein LOC128215545 [Mya arenaria]